MTIQGSFEGTSPSASSGAPRCVPRVRWRDGIGGALAYGRDPIDFQRRALALHGDIFEFRILGMPLTLINHPDFVQRVFVENSKNYDKDNFLFKIVRVALRSGLIANAGGEHWRKQRQLMNPSFTPRTVAYFAQGMVEETAKLAEQWARKPGAGHVVDVSTDIGELALRIVMRSVFSIESGNTVDLQRAFYELNVLFSRYFAFPLLPLSVPTPMHRRMRKLVQYADDRIFSLIQERVDGTVTVPQPDLLSLLMEATYEESGGHMTLEHLQHEVSNILTGAYETTTNTVSWVFYLLALHPEARDRLVAEVDRVCGGRLPTYEDFALLTYTRMVIDEALRLYSPAYQTMRRAVADDVVGGYHIPRNTNILINSYLLHRHPDYWDDPEDFRPERFEPEAVAKRAKHAYVPFGTGPRICIGKYFALTEVCMVVATISQRFRLELPHETSRVSPEPLVTLHPKGGVQLRLRSR